MATRRFLNICARFFIISLLLTLYSILDDVVWEHRQNDYLSLLIDRYKKDYPDIRCARLREAQWERPLFGLPNFNVTMETDKRIFSISSEICLGGLGESWLLEEEKQG